MSVKDIVRDVQARFGFAPDTRVVHKWIAHGVYTPLGGYIALPAVRDRGAYRVEPAEWEKFVARLAPDVVRVPVAG